MRALSLIALLLAPGCYRAHERSRTSDASALDAWRVDAGTDAFIEPDVGMDAPPPRVDANPTCDLPDVCPNVDYVMRLDRRATDWGDEACARMEVVLNYYPSDRCRVGANRFAIARCAEGRTEVRATVTRIGTDDQVVAWFDYYPNRCFCSRQAWGGVRVGEPIGMNIQPEDDDDGVIQFAFGAQDVSIVIEACAF